jgi:benzoyl-CoA reductase subunit B
VSKGQIWETRPLEFWAKAKELRAGWQDSIESKENVILQGGTGFVDWTVAFPAITAIEDNPVGSMIENKNSAFGRLSRLACEIRGWGREICGYHGTCWGGQFLGHQDDGTPFPERKGVLPAPCVCDSHAKRGQQVRDFASVPQWMDERCTYFGPRDAEREVPMIEHKTYNYVKILNDVERVFNQKLDEEEVVRQIEAHDIAKAYAGEITKLMAKSIPAPISVKDLYSVYTIGGLTKIDPQATIDFWKMVRDEVQWRADNHIAAVGNERFRWIEAHPPSWHYMKYYRYLEKYGAVCLGSQYSHIMGGGLWIRPDGVVDTDWEVIPQGVDPYPVDTPLKTREDIARYIVGPDARLPYTFKVDEYLFPDKIVEFAKIMQADGALLALWRHGVGCTLTRKEQGMRLRKAGLSVLHYEGSQPGERTDMDEKRFMDQLENWMASLGLEKLED